MKKNILVTGGAGYIGSHTLILLIEAGYSVIVFDNFSNSSIESIKRVEKIVNKTIKVIEGDIRNQDDSDFKMDIPAQLKKPNNQWRNATFSVTLNIFYFTELSFLGLVAFILSCR